MKIKVYDFELERVNQCQWLLKKKNGKQVIFFATESIINNLDKDVFFQANNVSLMPGLAGKVIIMPDAHSGYGAPIGTVFPMKKDQGYVAPGAVGYDINCGMRLLITKLMINDVKPKIKKLVDSLYQAVPVGVGRQGFLKVSKQQLKKLVEEGVDYLVNSLGLGWPEDIEAIEEKGKIGPASFSALSSVAIERGLKQLATLGSGNHYLEIQKVEKIYNQALAKKWGIEEIGQVTVMIHCGSRGLGHQVCSDYLRLFEKEKNSIAVDRQLVCLPVKSSLGKQYLLAMAASANFAFVNRQAITYQVRRVFERVFGLNQEKLGLDLVYDVAHNIAKFEGKFLIYRKGATRSFPNQPVIIGGSMETGSYLLVGTEEALKKSYGSTAHGSGRTMSRAKAKRLIHGQKLWQTLEKKGIYIKSASWGGLAEEAGQAYKNINQVVEAVSQAGLSRPVAYFTPLGNIKG